MSELPPGEKAYLADYLRQSAGAMAAFAGSAACADALSRLALAVTASLRDGGKLLIAGNGGSASDAQHIAGEFTGRLMYDRRPLAAVALTCETSGLTAVANDYGFEHVFSRQVLALGRAEDVFLGITTSGRSPNILRALEAARSRGMTTAVFTGGHDVAIDADIILRAPSTWTPLIQQSHIAAAHVFCALVERMVCPQ